MSHATIMLIVATVDIIEDSEFARLYKDSKKYARHDGINAIFAQVLPDVVNPIRVDDMLDAEGEKLTGDPLLFAVATVLFAEDRTRPIVISSVDLQALYDHPTYQIYAGNFDALADLNKVYKSVFGVDLSGDLDAAKVTARQSIKSYFGS